MMRYQIIYIILIAYLILGAGCNQRQAKRVCIRDVCVRSELALTPAEQSTGLMGRQYLAPDAGMLFIFARPATHNFWMKNMFIPLDIIWIGEDKKIVDCHASVQPCQEAACPSISPRVPCQDVLEVNAGFLQAYGITIGDEAKF